MKKFYVVIRISDKFHNETPSFITTNYSEFLNNINEIGYDCNEMLLFCLEENKNYLLSKNIENKASQVWYRKSSLSPSIIFTTKAVGDWILGGEFGREGFELNLDDEPEF